MGHFVADNALRVSENLPGMLAVYAVGIAAVAFIVGLIEEDRDHKGAIGVAVVGAIIAVVLFPSAYGASKVYCNGRKATTAIGQTTYTDPRCTLVFGNR